MKITLNQPADVGPLVRATRKAQGMRQDDTAGAIGVSENFLAKVEHGASKAQWDKLFQVLQGLGIHVVLDVPDDAMPYLPTALRTDV